MTKPLPALGSCPGSGVISGEEESDFYPFGGERVICDRLPDQNYKFTGKERDTETNLDYFGARYYSSSFGRFTTTDPITIRKARLLDPQQLNLYSYVRNSPTIAVDPDGREIIFKTRAQAAQGLAAAKAGLPPGQRNAVSIRKNDSGQLQLAVNPKAAKGAGETSLLGRLSAAATSPHQAQVNFVSPKETINFTTTDGQRDKTSLQQLTEDRTKSGDPGTTHGLWLPAQGNGEVPSSATLGMPQAFISTEAGDSTATTFFEEVVVHVGTFMATGDPIAASHPAVDEDSIKTAIEVEINEEDRRKKEQKNKKRR